MTRRKANKLTKDALSFRERAEDFLALAKAVAKSPKSELRDLLLRDARKTLAVVQTVMRHADDMRSWAHEVFGKKADGHPLMEFASNALTKSLNTTMGFQSYRMRQFLTGKRVTYSPHPAGTLALSALSQFVEH